MMSPNCRPLILAASIAVVLACVARSALAVTETVVLPSDGAWNTGPNWADNSAPVAGGTFSATRLNVNGVIIYDFPGVTTTFAAGGAEARPLGIASGSNTNGTLRVDNGTLVFTTLAGTGTNQGAFVTAAADAANNSTGLLHVNGGNVIINGPTSFLSLTIRGGSTSTGTLTIDNGSMTVDRIDSGSLGTVNAGATATVNLNGGTLNVRSISSGNAVMQFRVNLNGGTIATSGPALTGVDLIGANIDSGLLNGMVTFDTALGDGRISGTLTGTGGITKAGAGTLTMVGGTNYTGPTAVNGGTLSLTTAQSGTSSVTVAGGAGLGVNVSSSGATFTTPALTLGSTSGATVRLDFGGFAPSAANAVVNAANFTVAAGSILELFGNALGVGTFPLIDYTGTIQGAGFGGLTLAPIGLPRTTATLVDNQAETRVDVTVSQEAIKWIGNLSADWDFDDSGTGATEGTENWRTALSMNPTFYLQGSGGNDAVIFDDAATGSRLVNLTTALTPTSIVVNNTTAGGDYTFNGSGTIDGNAILTKNNTGTLIIANSTPNAYTGMTTINGGKLQVGDGISAGVGSLGTGAVVINGGMLEIARPDSYTLQSPLTGSGGTVALTAGDFILNHAGTNFGGMIAIFPGRVLTIANTATLNGAIVGEGNVLVNPFGNRTVTLGGDSGSDFTGGVTVTNTSHLRIMHGNALGSAATGTTVIGNNSTVDNDPVGASLQLAGGIVVAGEPLSMGGTGGSAAGLIAQRGALQSVSGENTWAGPVTLTGLVNRIGVQDGAALTVSGSISDGGAGFLMIFRGGTNTPGMITLSGTGNQWGQTNIYASTTRIAGGDDILPVNAPLFIGTNGVGMSIFDLNGRNQRVAGISQVAGTAATNFITNNGTADSVLTLDPFVDRTFSGALTNGPTNSLSLVKQGSYTQTLSGVSGYTGTTTVKAGTLFVSGSIAGSATTVEGGTLSGNGGTVGSVRVLTGGTLAAGTGIGLLTTGGLNLADGATLSLDIDSFSIAADTFMIGGNLDLEIGNGPTLLINDVGGGFALPPNTVIPFLNYSGVWNGGLFEVNDVPIADDSGSFTLGPNVFAIDYNYLGNGLALVVVVPEPATAMLMLGGLGVLLGRRRAPRRSHGWAASGDRA